MPKTKRVHQIARHHQTKKARTKASLINSLLLTTRRVMAGYIALLVVLVIGVVAYVSLPARADNTTSTYGIYIVGDSLSAGRSSLVEATTYRKVLEGYLQSHLMPGVDSVVTDEYPYYATQLPADATYYSGWHIADALTAVQNHAPTADTKLMVVEIGTNDVSAEHEKSGVSVTSVSTFTTRYNTLLANLRQDNSTAGLVCLSVWWQNSTAPFNQQPAYDSAISAACAKYGGKFVNLMPLYTAKNPNGTYKYHANNNVTPKQVGIPLPWYYNGSYATDTWHPNTAGHSAIAAAIEQAYCSLDCVFR